MTSKHDAAGSLRQFTTAISTLAGLLLLLTATSARAQLGGVLIDPDGVLRNHVVRRESPQLAERRREAFAQEHLPKELAPFAELRKVSLRTLESELAQAGSLAKLRPEAQQLYGLQRIDYVFIDADRQDVVLAGPAEGFAPDASGRLLGLTTGRPPLHLDDLLVALRWGAESGGRGDISCSIDPDPGRWQEMNSWVQANSNAVTRGAAESRFDTMARILGRMPITVTNVPADSRFARVLVEADYRMKLIAMGTERPNIKGLRSHLSLLTPEENSLQRWWFAPLYNPIEADAAGQSFRISGQRIQLFGQDEWGDGRGRRSAVAVNRASTQKFAQGFTEHIPELVEKSPIFAELQNVYDLALVAALIQREQLSDRLQWPMATFLDAAALRTQPQPVPRWIDAHSVTTTRNRFLMGIVGGVSIVPGEVLSQPRGQEQAAQLAEVRAKSVNTTGSENRMAWWD